VGAMHEVIIGGYREAPMRWFWTLDPVITVHPDEVFFEAFSTDESAYARLSAPISAFDVQGTPSYGTTNIDFTFELRDALQFLRTSRNTMFTVGAGGFNVQTKVGAVSAAHTENKVDLPESWLKGFLQVQGALAMKAFTFDVRPADLLTVIAYFLEHRETGISNGLRYDFKEGEEIGMLIDPHDTRFVLRGTHYKGYPRTVRVWGRRRLELLQYVLPYAERVTVGVLGRGLPHFYICHCRGYRFTLVLSGWTKNDWAKGSAFDLLVPREAIDTEKVAAVFNYLSQHFAATKEQIAAYTVMSEAEAEHALFELCKAGRAIYDPVTERYQHRELFQEPLDMDTLFAPDPKIELGRKLYESGAVNLISAGKSDVRKNEMKATATVTVTNPANPDMKVVNSGNPENSPQSATLGDTTSTYNVVVAIDREGRIRFAQCTCKFFKDNLMSRGPCEHILATRTAFDQTARANAGVE
jgi:hypothetical protein